MNPKINIGDKFFKLIVMDIIKNPKGYGLLYSCLCECGNKRLALAYGLNKQKIKSCGCARFIEKRKSTKFTPEIASYRAKVSNYKAHAKMDNRAFELTYDDAIELFKSKCHYCNTPPSNTYNLINRNRKYTKGTVYCLDRKDDYEIKYNGIDRLNSQLGYTKENCVACCFRCNSAKSNGSYDEFNTWINELVEFRKAK